MRERGMFQYPPELDYQLKGTKQSPVIGEISRNRLFKRGCFVTDCLITLTNVILEKLGV